MTILKCIVYVISNRMMMMMINHETGKKLEVVTCFEIVSQNLPEGTRKLTPWSRVPLEKLTLTQLVNKFPAFYATRRFVTVFTGAHH
jgi:hypothetical protein